MKLILRDCSSLFQVDFLVQFLGLLFVGELIVLLVYIIAQQSVDGEEDARQIVDGDHIVAVEIVETKYEADRTLLID